MAFCEVDRLWIVRDVLFAGQYEATAMEIPASERTPAATVSGSFPSAKIAL
jgi:hypothetical protein